MTRTAQASIVVLVLVLAEASGLRLIPAMLEVVSEWLRILPPPTESFAHLVGDLAWPGALIFLFLLFRADIGPLIRNLKRATWGDKTIEFDKGLEEAEEQANALPQPAEPLQQDNEGESSELTLEVAQFSPTLAVIEAWLPIERQLYALGNAHGYSSGRARSISFLLSRLTNDGVLDRQTVDLINQLRALRNVALHDQNRFSISQEDALRYSDLSKTLVEAIRRAMP